jgi:16S rRNA (cytidine1402-2'-O)-methyltransferase
MATRTAESIIEAGMPRVAPDITTSGVGGATGSGAGAGRGWAIGGGGTGADPGNGVAVRPTGGGGGGEVWTVGAFPLFSHPARNREAARAAMPAIRPTNRQVVRESIVEIEPPIHSVSAERQPIGARRLCKRGRVMTVTGLCIVATPIGNLGDLTPRAAEILREADIVACEDTRVTGKLLSANGISARMIAYHDHSSEQDRARLITLLENGNSVALVSDAGTPLISDPGYKLVRAAVEAGIPVTCAPGPSSPIAALVVSGLPSDRFLFAGYLPAKSGQRRAELSALAGVPATLIFLESTRRLAESLADMSETLGARDAAVARELTKLHEEVRRAPLADLAGQYAAEPAPRGEAVVVVGPPGEDAPAAADLDALLDRALATMSVRDAAATVAAATGRPRKEVYARALERSGEG